MHATSRGHGITTDIIWVSSIAFLWIIAFEFNRLVLNHFNYSTYASWIFLPAFLKVVFILISRWQGFLGLFLGGFYVNYINQDLNTFNSICLSLILGLGPLVALYIVNTKGILDESLKSITPYILVKFIIISCLLSAIFHGIYFYVNQELNVLIQSSIIFLGDIVGCMIMFLLWAKFMKLGIYFKKSAVEKSAVDKH